MSDHDLLQPYPGTPHKVRVLLVDDQLIIVEAVRRLLADQDDIELHYVLDATAAIPLALQLKPTVILQDLVMPFIDGFDTVRSFRQHPDLKDIPIIVLSSKDDPSIKAQGFAVGANDYLVKLPDKLELLARIRHHSEAYIHRLQRDEAFTFLRESQRQLAEANIQLQKLVALDGLTGIANRRCFDQTLDDEWQRAQRHQHNLALLFCDIDHFKLYNDTYGHLNGDFSLKKVAAVLTEHLKRPGDLVARYGGEEFVVLLPQTDLDGALAVAESCRHGVEQLKLVNAQAPSGFVTLSIGAGCCIPQPGDSYDSLIALTDRELYRAKGNGRNCVMAVESLALAKP
ncbi:MAG: diguanylate cyclase [Pseudomonas sp.]|uniref:diguanylate cyclase n=1 Tax=Pseudomonas sp. TaxID=306 RepID=UPI0033985EF0